MIRYLIVFAGLAVFFGGYYLSDKNKDSGLTMGIYAVLSYAGLVLVAIGGTPLLDPLINSVAPQYASTIRIIIQVALFILGAELVLKPAFEGQREKSKEKREKEMAAQAKKTTKKEKKPGSKLKSMSSYQQRMPKKPKNNPKKKKKR